jgi:hypothetical protein
MFKVGINSAPRIVPTETTETPESSSQEVTSEQNAPVASQHVAAANSSIRNEVMFSATVMRAQLNQQLVMKSEQLNLQNKAIDKHLQESGEKIEQHFNKAALENANIPSLNTLNTGSGDDFVFIQYDKTADLVHVSVNGKEAWKGTPEQFSNLKIDTGDGKDIVMINTPGANVVTGGGDDQVLVGVMGSQFDPEIEQRFGMLKINTGDGNDSVENRASSATIETGNGIDSVMNFGNNTTIITGEGVDYVHNEGDMNRIETENGNDQVQNYGNENDIRTGSGDDTVYNYGSDNEISTGIGNDSVSNHGAVYMHLSGEPVADLVDNGGGDRNRIDTGDGNDGIIFSFYADDNRVSTGSGDDYVGDRGSGNQVDAGEGNDSAD